MPGWLRIFLCLALIGLSETPFGSLAGPAEPAGPLLLSADELVYDFEKRAVIARGRVELSTGSEVLRAQEIRYDERENRVRARGDVVLIRPGGEAIFADQLEITGDLREGFVRQVSARLDRDTRIAANLGLRTGGRYNIFEKAVFSPCPVCPGGKEGPFWQIRARRVIHDQKKRTLTYYGATLEILGVPVAYTPYFSHPDPTVKRRSGFLTPSFGTESELGATLETPYYFVLAPNRDLTLTPHFSTRQGLMLLGEFRDLERFGRTDLEASATYAEGYRRNPSDDRNREFRGHVRARGNYRVGSGERAGFEIALSSDNTYLDTYGLRPEDVLTNRLYGERFEGRDYYGLSAYGFQGLREDDNQDRIPFALPLFEMHRIGRPMLWGSHWTVDAGLLGLARTAGLDTRRATAELGWELPRIGPIGDLWRLRLKLRGDVYWTDGDPVTLEENGSRKLTARLLPQLHLSWSWPLVGETAGWRYLLEPVASFTADRSDGNPDGIPNEDSQSFEFDETNLFTPSRFSGLDRVEEGLRLAYGGRFTAVAPTGWRVGGSLGQLIIRGNDDIFPENSGLEGRFSDLVGRLDLLPGPLFNLAYRFRFAPADLSFRRNELAATIGPRRLRFRVSYLDLLDDPKLELARKRKEVVAGVRLGLTDTITVGAQTRRDLANNETISTSVGISYQNPCFTLTAGFERRFTTKGELEDERVFKVRIGFAGLGDVRTSGSLRP